MAVAEPTPLPPTRVVVRKPWERTPLARVGVLANRCQREQAGETRPGRALTGMIDKNTESLATDLCQHRMSPLLHSFRFPLPSLLMRRVKTLRNGIVALNTVA